MKMLSLNHLLWLKTPNMLDVGMVVGCFDCTHRSYDPEPLPNAADTILHFIIFP